MTKDQKARLAEALERFKLADDAYASQAERELKVLKFDAGDQWPDFVKTTRAGSPPNQPGTVAARPMLTIPKLDQPVQQVINQQKNADFGVNIRPQGNSSIDEAKYRQGLIRQIQTQSRAKLARNWAYERSTKAGRGCYAIRKVYTDDKLNPFDMELRIDRLLDQSKTAFDPFAQQPDWSDGEWAFEWGDVPEKAFKRDYPKSKLSKAGESELTAMAEQYPGWIGGDKAGRSFRVANYWYASYTPRTVRLYSLPDGSELVQWDDADEPLPDGAEPVLRDDEPVMRVVQDRRIDCCKITATEILEETEWEGKHIPLIPVIAKEYNLNGQRLWKGMIEGAMDAQRLFNFTASAIAEGVGIGAKAPFILDPEQIEGYEKFWKEANTRNFPYLPRRAFTDRGDPFPPIERNTAEPPIQAMSQLLGQADGFINATTATPASAKGDIDPTHRSGKAVEALQAQSELANSNYLDNLATISMSLEGIILNEMLAPVYDRKGRVVQILGEDDEPETVVLGQPFVKGKHGPEAPPPVPVQGQKVQEITLKSDFDAHVVIEVGKSFTTKRREGAAAMGDLIPHLQPQQQAVVMPDYVKTLDFPGAQKMAAKLEATIPPEMRPPEEGQPDPIPPQVKAKMQQMEAALGQAQQLIEGKGMELQSKERETGIKASADLEKTKLQIASDERIAMAANDVKMADIESRINAAVAQAMIAYQQEHSVLGLEHAHERQMADVAHSQQAALASQGHQQNLEAGQQAAALAPSPNGAGA